MASLIDSIAGHDARHRVIFGSAAGAIVFFSLRNHVRLPTDIIAAWDTFAFCVLASAWLTILITPQRTLRDVAVVLFAIAVIVRREPHHRRIGWLLAGWRISVVAPSPWRTTIRNSVGRF